MKCGSTGFKVWTLVVTGIIICVAAIPVLGMVTGVINVGMQCGTTSTDCLDASRR